MAGDLIDGGGGGSAAGKGPRSSTRHRQFCDCAKTRVDDLQEIFFGLESARKESRSADAAVLEEQVQRRLPCILPTANCLYDRLCARQRLFLLRRRRRRKRGVELLVVGRRAESRELPLTAGISNWSEHLKLWVLGDLLTSVDFGSRLSMLVVQQQTKAAAQMREKEIREREERVAAALAGKQEHARVHGQRNNASATSRVGAPRFGAAQREEDDPSMGLPPLPCSVRWRRPLMGRLEVERHTQCLVKSEDESRRDENLKYNCKCSFLEIYNEQITDLLDPSSQIFKYAREPNIMRYIKIAAMLPNRTIRDVALRC
ncbi:hypothetical protein ZWY2020_034379 [Hordeum vulgare]|nr:hypothetical protein ZWY2020_034379 [Hordeum vulgare]